MCAPKCKNNPVNLGYLNDIFVLFEDPFSKSINAITENSNPKTCVYCVNECMSVCTLQLIGMYTGHSGIDNETKSSLINSMVR